MRAIETMISKGAAAAEPVRGREGVGQPEPTSAERPTSFTYPQPVLFPQLEHV